MQDGLIGEGEATLKKLVQVVAKVLVFPAACLSAFGRWYQPYLFFAHTMAMMPGIAGSYLRVAYYSLTLEHIGPDCHMAFGTFIVHPKASLGPRVGMGAYCVLGQVDIGEGTLLASGVQVLSGTRQHKRDERGWLSDEGREFRRISIGPHCWIGSGAIIMADVGEKVDIAPGSVVRNDLPSGASVAGNPARNFATVVKPAS